MTHCVTSSNKTRKGDGVIRSLTALPNQYITGLKKKEKYHREVGIESLY